MGFNSVFEGLNGQQKLLNTHNEGIKDSSDQIRRKRRLNTISCVSLTRNLGQKKTQFLNVMPDWKLSMYTMKTRRIAGDDLLGCDEMQSVRNLPTSERNGFFNLKSRRRGNKLHNSGLHMCKDLWASGRPVLFMYSLRKFRSLCVPLSVLHLAPFPRKPPPSLRIQDAFSPV